MNLIKEGSLFSSMPMDLGKNESFWPAKQICIHPYEAYQDRQHLFEVLEKVFPVQFVSAEQQPVGEADALILLGDDLPGFQYAEERGIPCFAVASEKVGPVETKIVNFSQAGSLDTRLKGADLVEEFATGVQGIALQPGDEVLASMGAAPVWIHRTTRGLNLDLTSIPPENISGNEILKHHLQGTRFLSLLPLYHFLRKVTADSGWSLPPLRANIHFDDPNLHWPTYGQIDYPHLADHAEKHNYHASMATIPLDCWYAHPRAVEIFRKFPHRLSLLIHGNNHTSNEFGDIHDEIYFRDLLSQALSRASRFERRYSIPISRVMAFPQEACRAEVVPAILDAGFEGITSTRYLPWKTGFRLTNIPASECFSCSWPAEMIHGVLPVLRRLYLRHANSNPWVRGEMVIGAYLGQPVILYGHHYDLDPSLELLEEWAHYLNSRYEIDWTSLEKIARGSYMTRLRGDTLYVRLFTRLAVIPVPEGIQRIVAESGGGQNLSTSPDFHWTVGSTTGSGSQCVIPIGNEGKACTVEIRMITPPSCPTRNNGFHRPTFWPYVRRILTEVEDRLRPALVKARLL